MIVHFIRHGLTEANETTGICGRRIDWPLSENGRNGILELARHGIYPEDPGALYASTLVRTQQTLRLVYPEVPFEATHLLDERDLGIIEYITDPAVGRERLKHLADENGRERPDAYPGGEDFERFSERVLRDFNALLESAEARGQEEITIFGHGSYLRQVGICFEVPGYTNVRPIVKNGTGFTFEAARRAEGSYSLSIVSFIGGNSLGDLLIRI